MRVVELLAAVHDKVNETLEERLGYECYAAEEIVSYIRVWAVKNRVHLIVRLRAMGASHCSSSCSRISYTFGAVASAPAFV